MKHFSLLLSALLALAPFSASAQDDTPLDTSAKKISYALGFDFASTMKRQGADLEPDLFLKGMQDAIAGSEALLSEEDARKTLIEFQMQLREKATKMREKQAAENIEKGNAFLEANKAKDGVTVTESGLQYDFVSKGDGQEKPQATDRVKVHYTGRLIDGTVFDSSVERGQPAVFPLRGVIPAWTEAVQLMSVGDKLHIVAPPDIAYGARGAPPRIGPNAVLEFDIELLEINPEPQSALPRAPASDGGSASN